jgi:hypothetical protein
VQFRLNQHVQNEQSAKLWKRADIRDIFELQEWRCADFGLFFSAVMVSGNGCSLLAIGSTTIKTTTCAATFGSSSSRLTLRGRLSP